MERGRSQAGDGGAGHADSQAVITPYEDGPYLVRGSFVVRDQEGHEIDLSRRTIALCRCGRSRIRPLCDGTHRAVRFRCPGVAERWPARAESVGDPDAVLASPPPSLVRPAPTPADVLAAAERAHVCLLLSLDGPCRADDYARMRLAEPLVGAACSLLGWQAGTGSAAILDESVTAGGPDLARRLVGRALRDAMRLPAADSDARRNQIRSLLRDAAGALRGAGEVPAGGSPSRQGAAT